MKENKKPLIPMQEIRELGSLDGFEDGTLIKRVGETTSFVAVTDDIDLVNDYKLDIKPVAHYTLDAYGCNDLFFSVGGGFFLRFRKKS